jgi:parvulin-like peptidyl-prolyl isomerase
MKRVLVMLALMALGIAPRLFGAEPRLVNGYAAIVNNRVITYQQVEAQLRPSDIEAARIQFGRQPVALAQELDRLRQDALTGLIERQLILHDFEAAGHKLPQNLIDEHIKDRIREEYGDRARLMRTLQAQSMTLEGYRERIREDFIVGAMTGHNISSLILISPHKVENYYKENEARFKLKDRIRLRLIALFNRPDRSAQATREIAEELAAKLSQGASFKDLASQYSEDSFRRQGGDRGWIEMGSTEAIRDDLQEIAFALKPGVPSQIIQKDEGCYLMLVEEFQPAHTRTLLEVRDEIEEALRRQERSRLRDEWIHRLRNKSFVRLFPLR